MDYSINREKHKEGEMFNDLREFIQKVKELGECREVKGADWEPEIGAITDLVSVTPNSPLLLFDDIKGYPAGYRVASNLFTTPRRTALALGLPLEAKGMELVKAWRNRIEEGIKPIPPVEVKTAPVKENILIGDDVDLFRFPTPKWHEFDGGRYIGTGSICITRDPDEGWVNLGCYRVQIHDKSTATIYTSPGHHGDIIRRKYWDRGLSWPVAVTCGQEPMLWTASIWSAPWGVCEYDIGGWLRRKPVEVTKGVTTDLPIPATAEIVLEGEVVPPEVETRIEGPFGEWSGYYAGGGRPEPAFKVKSILHRNSPIIQGNPPSRLISVWSLGRHIMRAGMLWTELDEQVPGVVGVWQVEEAAGHSMVVISLKQQYAGHAKQAAMIAAGSSVIRSNLRWVIVVDDDIDPSNLSEVLWALGTRTELDTSIDIIKGCTSSPLDPTISPEKRSRGELGHSMGIILACKPYHWIKEFPPSIKTNPELAKKIREKWAELFP